MYLTMFETFVIFVRLLFALPRSSPVSMVQLLVQKRIGGTMQSCDSHFARVWGWWWVWLILSANAANV